MDTNPRRRDKIKTIQNSFDAFYTAYCERPKGSKKQSNRKYCYVAVLFNLYKLTTEDKVFISIKEFCDALRLNNHYVYRMPSGHFCVNQIQVKEDYPDLLATAIKAANTYEKEQGREYDYAQSSRQNNKRSNKKSL